MIKQKFSQGSECDQRISEKSVIVRNSSKISKQLQVVGCQTNEAYAREYQEFRDRLLGRQS